MVTQEGLGRGGVVVRHRSLRMTSFVVAAALILVAGIGPGGHAAAWVQMSPLSSAMSPERHATTYVSGDQVLLLGAREHGHSRQRGPGGTRRLPSLPS